VTQEEKDLAIGLGALILGGGLLAWWLKSIGIIQSAGMQASSIQTPQEYADSQDQVPPFVPGT
jgi:hypothetical protein